MTGPMITLSNGVELSFAQATELGALMLVAKTDGSEIHWHVNDCGCCVTLHGPDYAYVIGRDGESTFFAERGCSCE
jgi:hypothetical protein